jgi:GNAT superfamily N-acetyltransferase
LLLCFQFLPCRIEIKVRPAKLTDAGIIAEFNTRMAWETEKRQLDSERVKAGVTALLRDATKGSYFVAEVPTVSGRAVAGQLLITSEWSDWRNGNFWWVQSMYVAEAFRRNGIFRALFRHVQALARTRSDVCGLRLYMDSHNDRARQAYERLGWKLTNYQIYEMDFMLIER